MPLIRGRSIALLTLAASSLALTSLIDLGASERRPALRLPEPRADARDVLIAARPAELAPLRFGWPSEGRVFVAAEHRCDERVAHETFVLAWHALPDASLLVEAFPSERAEYDASAPGAMRTSGTLLTPVQALVASDGRFVATPGIDDLRDVWNQSAGHRADAAVPEPLAECWSDWVERWLGLALAPGEERALPLDEPDEPDARAWIRCARLDVEAVRLEYHLERGRRDATPSAKGAAGETLCALERTVEAELDPLDLRPRRVHSLARWTWTRGATLVRSVERESRYAFDWTPERVYLSAAARSAVAPAEVEAWAARRWPAPSADERAADVDEWRDLWRAFTPPRRAQLLAEAHAGCLDLGSGRSARREWLGIRSALGRLWSCEDPARPARLPVRTWMENGPPETSVDVLFVGDGYTADELGPDGKYWLDVRRVASGLFEQAPLVWYRDWFNVRALFLESEERGCDQGEKLVRTALNAKSDGRGLWLEDDGRSKLQRLLRGLVEPDVVFVIVNEDFAAGAGGKLADPMARTGTLAMPMFSAGGGRSYEVAAHELGHSFAHLADEYVDDELARQGIRDSEAPNACSWFTVLLRNEPWRHFESLPGAARHRWSHEGAAYRAHGWYRPWPRCRMDDASDPFCPVCCEAVARAIFDTCGIEWDDAAYHAAHSLALWESSGAQVAASELDLDR